MRRSNWPGVAAVALIVGAVVAVLVLSLTVGTGNDLISMAMKDIWEPGLKVVAVQGHGQPALRPGRESEIGKLVASNSKPKTYKAGTNFQWKRCDGQGNNCVDIPGATGPTYVLTGADTGHSLRVLVDGVLSPPYGATSSLGTSLAARMPESSGTQTLIVTPSGSGSSSCTSGSPCSLTRAFALATSGTIIQARGNAGVYGVQTITGKTYSVSNPVTLTTFPGDPIATFSGSPTQPSTAISAVFFGQMTALRIRNVKFNAAFNVSCLKVEDTDHFELDDIIEQECGKNNVTSSWVGAIGVLASGGGARDSLADTDFQVWNSVAFNWRQSDDNPGHNHAYYLGTVRGGTMANNTIYNTAHGGGYGIQVGGSANNMIFANNTIDEVLTVPGGGGSGMTIWLGDPAYYGSPATSGNLIINNLLTNNASWGLEGCGVVPVVPNIARNNGTFGNGLGAYRPAGCVSPNAGTFTVQSPNYTNDPLYVNRTARDYHLQSGSQTRGKADPAYTPPVDADGNLRPLAPALGAFN